MKVAILAVVVAVVYCISTAESKAPNATCKEFVGILTKKQLGGISSCSKSMKFKNPKDKAAKMNCILKCVLKKEGMLTKEGQFDNVQFDKFLDSIVPENLWDHTVPRLTKCRDVEATFDDKEEYCKSYDPLIKCMLDVMGSLCKDAPA